MIAAIFNYLTAQKVVVLVGELICRLVHRLCRFSAAKRTLILQQVARLCKDLSNLRLDHVHLDDIVSDPLISFS